MFTSYVASQVALVSHHHHTQSGNNIKSLTQCQECIMQEGGADSCEEECSNDD